MMSAVIHFDFHMKATERFVTEVDFFYANVCFNKSTKLIFI